MNQDSRDAAAHLSLPIIRTHDIKDQMIEEAQVRRKRMHEAVDLLEVTAHARYIHMVEQQSECVVLL